MASIRREMLIDVEPGDVWDAVRDIGAVHRRLAPGFVVDTKLDGNARIATFGNGMLARELIVDVGEEARRLVWSVVGARLTHHNASLQVLAEGNGRCRVVWIADLLPNDLAGVIAAMIEQGTSGHEADAGREGEGRLAGLTASFKLGDAQELVARQHGFESWQALKQGLATMAERADHAQPRPVIAATAAELFVSDIEASCDFFTQKLGFSIVFVYGKPPFYAQVKRDNGLLNLKCVEHPVIDPQLRDRESLLSADLGLNTPEEIKQLYLEFQAAGVTFFQTLRKEPWGAKTFIVKDPDGNLLLFAGPAE